MNQKKLNAAISPNDYLPRALFGKYLNWVYKYLLSIAPKNIKIIHHKTKVEHIHYFKNDLWQVVYSVNKKVSQTIANFIFLTTGHSQKLLSSAEFMLQKQVKKLRKINPLLQIIFDPYPIQKKLQQINNNYVVAVEGAGLTTFDIIAELTLGRGGKFHEKDGELTYISSGEEPSILLFSRTGLPLTARGKNQKGVCGQYKAKFLTMDKIKELRDKSILNQLDFHQQIFPLLLLDMAYAYYFAFLKKKKSVDFASSFCSQFVTAKNGIERAILIAKHIPKKHRFSWDKLVNPLPKYVLRSQATFRKWLMEYLQKDVAQAKLGNIDSPVKAACDVLRDIRDTLRYAIDFAGLTPVSYARFLNDFVPAMNRLAVGPPVQRIEELMALMKAGIVHFDFGPAPSWSLDNNSSHINLISNAFKIHTKKADVLIRARIALPNPLEDKSSLMKSMLQAGIVRPFANKEFSTGGIEVDQHLNVVNQEGKSIQNIWAIGVPTEGCKFYTFIAPRPGVNSTFIVDAGRTVASMMQQIEYETNPNIIQNAQIAI